MINNMSILKLLGFSIVAFFTIVVSPNVSKAQHGPGYVPPEIRPCVMQCHEREQNLCNKNAQDACQAIGQGPACVVNNIASCRAVKNIRDLCVKECSNKPAANPQAQPAPAKEKDEANLDADLKKEEAHLDKDDAGMGGNKMGHNGKGKHQEYGGEGLDD